MAEAPQEEERKFDRTWITVQKKTFTRWANNFLADRKLKIEDIEINLDDGIMLINLLEILSNKTVGKFNKAPKLKPQKLENIGLALQFIDRQGVKLVSIGPEDIFDHNLKLILGLIWTLILRFQIQRGGDAGSAKAELLEWVRKQVAPYGLKPKNFTIDWTDGKLLSALTDSLRPGVINMAELPEALPAVEQAMETANKEYQIPRILDAQDMVDVPDELSNMTYISYFRDWWNQDQINRAKEIEEERLRKLRTADPSQCFAFGPGLEAGTTNNDCPFTIQSVNYFGDNLPVGGNEFVVVVGGPSPVEVTVKDNGDGTYSANYRPTLVGDYKVNISLRDAPIKGSPYGPVHISGPDANYTIARGPGVEGARVGKPAPFQIISHSKDGKPVLTGGDPFTVEAFNPDGSPLAVDITDNKNGTYDVVYTPNLPGFYNIEVKLAGQHIKNSAFKPLMEVANAHKSWAEGPGLVEGKTTRNNPFTIHAVDGDGNPVTHGGDPFVVGISGPSSFPVAITDNHDGTYSVNYVVDLPGDYIIDVSLHGTPIRDAPFKVLIKPNVDANYSYAAGPGLEGAVDNEPAHFTIFARDGDDKPRTEGGDSFEVVIDGPAPANVQIVDNGDGTYAVTYEPIVAGDYLIRVNLEGQPIKNSPYSVKVTEGIDLDNTGFVGFSFTVQTQDKNKQKRTFGGDLFQIDASGPAAVELNTQDNGDGSYTASFVPPVRGEYSFVVKFNGKTLNSQPLKIVF